MWKQEIQRALAHTAGRSQELGRGFVTSGPNPLVSTHILSYFKALLQKEERT